MATGANNNIVNVTPSKTDKPVKVNTDAARRQSVNADVQMKELSSDKNGDVMGSTTFIKDTEQTTAHEQDNNNANYYSNNSYGHLNPSV